MSTQAFVQVWTHYLSSEEGRSPATVKEYAKDIRLLRHPLPKPRAPDQDRSHDTHC